jgi:hypothetical protein
VLLDGQEIHINNVARGSNACQVQDTIFAVDLSRGIHSLMTKVFEGGGGHNVQIRLQDPVSGDPIVDGFSICLSPELGECVTTPPPTRFVRGDADASNVINLTDGIVILSFLFTGGPAPRCMDAADTDDSGGRLNLTDAIIIFNWLFTGGAAPKPPSPTATTYPAANCGSDPTEGDGLDCANSPSTCR